MSITTARNSRRSTAALGLIVLITGLAAGCQSAPPEKAGPARPLEPGNRRQLLSDDVLVASKAGFAITPNQAGRTESPVLEPEAPWEQGGIHVESVQAHKGLYRLW